jgi:hypothetical protein
MAKRFMPGLKYVFTKKKYIKDSTKKGYKGSMDWVNEVNGNEVTNKDSFSGEVGLYWVSPEWCKCIGKE